MPVETLDFKSNSHLKHQMCQNIIAITKLWNKGNYDNVNYNPFSGKTKTIIVN